MDKLYGYYLHYNPYTGLWAAFKRDEQHEYTAHMHPVEGTKALFSQDINTLIEVINGHQLEVRDVYREFGLEKPKDGVG